MKTSSWSMPRSAAVATVVAGLLLAGGAWAFRSRSTAPAASVGPVGPVGPGPAAKEWSSGDASRTVTETGVQPGSPSAEAPSPSFAPSASSASTATPALGAAPAAAVPETQRAQILEKIQAAATRYDASAIPELKPHLLHSDPELREAARDAMMQLGVAEAAEALREAASKVRDPREAVALLDAADFVELPPALPAKARPPGAPAPTTSPSPRRPMSKKAAN